jgi:hypothetical protein
MLRYSLKLLVVLAVVAVAQRRFTPRSSATTSRTDRALHPHPSGRVLGTVVGGN